MSEKHSTEPVGTGNETPRPRRQRRKDARPGEIIEAGLTEFAERGFAGARMEEIARRAGVVKGTLYRYFPGKQALFEAATRAHIAPVLDSAEHLATTYDGPAEELLRLIIKTLHQRLTEGGAGRVVRILISDGERFPELTAFYHRETISRGKAVLQRIVERGVAAGEFRASAVTTLPMIIMSPFVMLTIWTMLFDRHQPIDRAAFLQAHLDLVFHGLKNGPHLPHGRKTQPSP